LPRSDAAQLSKVNADASQNPRPPRLATGATRAHRSQEVRSDPADEASAYALHLSAAKTVLRMLGAGSLLVNGGGVASVLSAAGWQLGVPIALRYPRWHERGG